MAVARNSIEAENGIYSCCRVGAVDFTYDGLILSGCYNGILSLYDGMFQAFSLLLSRTFAIYPLPWFRLLTLLSHPNPYIRPAKRVSKP